jgi:ABC-2 type transport system permease protein
MLVMSAVFASAGAEASDTVRFFTPAIVAFSIVNAGFTSLAIGVTVSRDEGILKRVHGTPLPTWIYLIARIVHASLLGLLLAAVVALMGAIAFSVPLPTANLPMIVVVLLVGAGSFCALGLAVSGLIPNANAAPAVVNAIVLPLLFVSNVFIRVEEGIIVTVGNVFPVRPFAESLQALWLGGPFGTFQPTDLLFVAAWGVVGALVAVRTFSWEPRV